MKMELKKCPLQIWMFCLLFEAYVNAVNLRTQNNNNTENGSNLLPITGRLSSSRSFTSKLREYFPGLKKSTYGQEDSYFLEERDGYGHSGSHGHEHGHTSYGYGHEKQIDPYLLLAALAAAAFLGLLGLKFYCKAIGSANMISFCPPPARSFSSEFSDLPYKLIDDIHRIFLFALEEFNKNKFDVIIN